MSMKRIRIYFHDTYIINYQFLGTQIYYIGTISMEIIGSTPLKTQWVMTKHRTFLFYFN